MRSKMSNRAPPAAINRSAQGTIDSRHNQRKQRKEEKYQDKREMKKAKFADKMAANEFNRQPYSKYNQRQEIVTRNKKDTWDKVNAVGGIIQGVGGIASAAAAAFI